MVVLRGYLCVCGDLLSPGMAFGLFLSAICPTENAALQAAVAAFYPTILLSGKLKNHVTYILVAECNHRLAII